MVHRDGLGGGGLQCRVAAAEADQRLAGLRHVGHAHHLGNHQQVIARRDAARHRALEGGEPAKRDQRP